MLYYKEYKPTKKLNQFIECYWELKDSLSDNQILQECLVPGGRAELIFTNSHFFWFGNDKLNKPTKHSDSFLLGQRNSVKYIGLSGDCYFIGVRFKHGCQSLFQIYPANKYTNKLIPLVQLYGANEKALSQRVLKSNSIDDSIGYIETWLLTKLTIASPDWQHIQDYIRKVNCENIESVSIKQLSELYGWSYKKTERTFLRYTGYTPKAFIKLVRFKRTLEGKSSELNSLTKLAHNFGFYDQSHFIREFYNYAGDKPSSFYKKPSQFAALLYKMKS